MDKSIQNFTIISRDDCSWCDRAKEMITRHGHYYKEIKVPHSLSREEFFNLVEKHQTTKTVPKIFLGSKLIGGYDDLADWYDDHPGGFGDGQL
jgi:glutaredoxin